MLRPLAILLLLAAPLLGHPHEKLDVDFAADQFESLSKARTISVYEGLPHQATEAAVFAREVQRRDAREIGGFHFYDPARKLAPETADPIRRVLADPESFKPWNGEKRCGGFHPDWSVVWRKGWHTHHAQVCFGCNEIIFLNRDVQLRYDLTPAAVNELKKLLSPLRSKRPMS